MGLASVEEKLPATAILLIVATSVPDKYFFLQSVQ